MKKVLICDDDNYILQLTKAALTKIGWQVYTSTDCTNIIEKVQTVNPSVILMDNQIPDVGGIATTRILKKDSTLKHIPVVFFTSNDNIQILAKRAGAEFYLEKSSVFKNLENVMFNAYNRYILDNHAE